jgi:MEDS: MEthanogen/methylotroph, DcmR Sensory domain
MSAGPGRLAVGPREHVVQFYGHEEELAGSVGGYLAEALGSGAVAVVVCTAAHWLAFGERLTAAGIDVAAARDAGALIVADAAETMGLFLIGDQPDPGDFQRVIGGLIRRAAAAGRPVRIYGEMVALLWDAGLVSAAIELEALWSELAALLSFSLVCGYPVRSVSGDDHADALAQVCGLHSAIVSGA